MSVEWDFGEKISDKIIKKTEKYFKVTFPDDYKSVVKSNDGASPSPDCWDIPGGEKEKTFDALIPLSGDEDESITDHYETLKDEYNVSDLIPFALDAFGNYICFKIPDMRVFYFDTEAGESVFVTESFSEFISLLYEPEDE